MTLTVFVPLEKKHNWYGHSLADFEVLHSYMCVLSRKKTTYRRRWISRQVRILAPIPKWTKSAKKNIYIIGPLSLAKCQKIFYSKIYWDNKNSRKHVEVSQYKRYTLCPKVSSPPRSEFSAMVQTYRHTDTQLTNNAIVIFFVARTITYSI